MAWCDPHESCYGRLDVSRASGCSVAIGFPASGVGAFVEGWAAWPGDMRVGWFGAMAASWGWGWRLELGFASTFA